MQAGPGLPRRQRPPASEIEDTGGLQGRRAPPQAGIRLEAAEKEALDEDRREADLDEDRADRRDAPDIEFVNRRRSANRRSRQRGGDLLIGAFWTSVAASVALWIAAGGLRRMPDTGGVLLAVGIVSGLVATDLLLVMLVLAARVPFIDRAIGQDSAIAFHRRLGTPAMALLVAHLVCVVTGYAMIEPANPVAEAVRLVAAGADLTAAYGAFARHRPGRRHLRRQSDPEALRLRGVAR